MWIWLSTLKVCALSSLMKSKQGLRSTTWYCFLEVNQLMVSILWVKLGLESRTGGRWGWKSHHHRAELSILQVITLRRDHLTGSRKSLSWQSLFLIRKLGLRHIQHHFIFWLWVRFVAYSLSPQLTVWLSTVREQGVLSLVPAAPGI